MMRLRMYVYIKYITFYCWPTFLPMILLLALSGVGQVHVSSDSEPGDVSQGPAEPRQIPDHSGQRPVPQEPAYTHQGMDSGIY